MRVQDQLKAGDVMSVPVISVPTRASVETILRIMRSHAIGALPVTDETGRPVGIITATDLSGVMVAGTSPQTAADVMSGPPRTVDVGVSADAIEALFETYQIEHVLVMNADRLVGIVSTTDLADRGIEGAPPGRARRASDEQLSRLILANLRAMEPSLEELPDFSVCGGIVQFWRDPPSADELEAVVRAALAAQI